MTTHDQIICRLCSAAASYSFTLTVLKKYPVGYYSCGNCKSLQTEPPFWLAEAYSSNLNDLDTGAAQRNLENLAISLTIARLFRFSNMIDIGGGDGLLCRLLRDHGLNAYVSDNYAQPVYAQGFAVPDFSRPDMLTAFEVFEHFDEPHKEVSALFAMNPSAILIMTTPYHGEGPEWEYLIPKTGHHIFFYGERALEKIAADYGYDLLRNGNYTLFCKPGLLTGTKRLYLKFRLRSRIVRMFRALIAYRVSDGYVRDARLRAEQTLR